MQLFTYNLFTLDLESTLKSVFFGNFGSLFIENFVSEFCERPFNRLLFYLRIFYKAVSKDDLQKRSPPVVSQDEIPAAPVRGQTVGRVPLAGSPQEVVYTREQLLRLSVR